MDRRCWAVAGGQNLDLLATAHVTYRSGDSNPGAIEERAGGVGFNMARNLALLDQTVHFLTARGDDRAGHYLDAIGRSAHLNLEHVLVRQDMSTSRYIAIHNETGDMVAAINDMSIFDTLDVKVVESWRALTNISAVLIDANLPEGVIDFLGSTWSVPIFADAVSQAKVDRLRPILSRLTGVKVNRLEAEHLTGTSVVSSNDAIRAALILLEMGVGSVCISLGSEGALFAKEGNMVFTRFESAGEPVNTTGAGDAMTAVFSWAVVEGLPLEQVARLSQAAASLVIESPDPINREMTVKILWDRANAPELSSRYVKG